MFQDHYKWVKNSNEPAEPSNVPKLNLGLAEGQTFKINLAVSSKYIYLNHESVFELLWWYFDKKIATLW